MTENKNISHESEFIDKTVTRSGTEEVNGTKCRWELHALPEYVDDDEKLSIGVIDKVTGLLTNKGYKDATIIVAEGYESEDFGKEHYRLTMIFGNGCESKKFIYAKGYFAESDHGEVKGEVRSIVGLLTDSSEDFLELSEEAASIYIEEMELTYTDWKNEWEGGMFVAVAN